MRLTRDDIIEALKVDESTEEYELRNSFSVDDEREMMIRFAPNDCMERITAKAWELWDEFNDDDVIYDIIELMDTWAEDKRMIEGAIDD